MEKLNQNNVLIDPSLVLAENSMPYTFDLIQKYRELGYKYQFHYPKSLYSLIMENGVNQNNPIVKFFLHGAYSTDLHDLSNRMKQFHNIVSVFAPTSEQRIKHSRMYETLSEELIYRDEATDRELRDILFEEWVFLQEYSWAVSRIKKPFNRFIAAGAVCIHYGRRAIDEVTRKTLKKEDDEAIGNIERLRAFGKWIAVGGASASTLISPVVARVTLPMALGWYLLLDP